MAEQIIGSSPQISDLIKDTSTEKFMEDVIEPSKDVPILVDFWAPWCEPCKQLGPLLEKIVSNSEGKVKLVKLNIDDEPQIAQQLQIQSIPAVFAFKDGQPIDAFVGMQTEPQIKAFIEKIAGPIGPAPVDQALAAALNELNMKNYDAAENLFLQVLGFDSENPEAIAGLAKVYINNKEIDKAKEILDGLTDALKDNESVKSALSALSLSSNNESIDIDQLTTKLKDDPENLDLMFELAGALAGKNNYSESIDNLLKILTINKSWNDGAAKEKLLKIFEVLGPNEELTQKSRRKLSSIIFS